MFPPDREVDFVSWSPAPNTDEASAAMRANHSDEHPQKTVRLTDCTGTIRVKQFLT